MTGNLFKRGGVADYLSFVFVIAWLFFIFFWAYKIAEPVFEERQAHDMSAEFEKNQADYFLLSLLKTKPYQEYISKEIITYSATQKKDNLGEDINTMMLITENQEPWEITIDGQRMAGSSKTVKKDTQQESKMILPLPLGSDKKNTEVRISIYQND